MARYGRAFEDVGRAVRTIRSGPQPLTDLRWLAWLLAWRATLGVAKRVVSLPRLVKAVRITAVNAALGGEAEIRTALVGQWFREDSPVLPGNCLERSLLVHATWASVHQPSQLRVGFRRERAVTLGHTWVTTNGALVLEAAEAVSGFEVACVFDDTGARHAAQPAP